MSTVNYPIVALNHVYLHANREEDRTAVLSLDEIYVVWFCYILGGWKALVSTSVQDNKYYEVTYDKHKKQTYIDTYIKSNNSVYGDVE